MHYKALDNSEISGFSLHDDMGGGALSLPSWPQGAMAIPDAEAAAIREANKPQVIPEMPVDPVMKLKNFIAANPDIKALLK